MNELLQIIGSIASIGSIPLAIYLYLKSQAQKYLEIRRDIVNRLSFQFGAGRKLSLFEIQSVIESKARESRVNPRTIKSDEVIEDLVTETLNNPLLESEKKQEIIENLKNLHNLGRLFKIVSSDVHTFEKFREFLADSSSDTEIEEIKKSLADEIESDKERRSSNTPEIFAKVATMLTAFAMVISISGINTELFPKLLDSEVLTNVSLGAITSVIAAAIVFLMQRYIQRKHNKSMEDND